ncbi:Hypothetical predicted protein, partial [Pelobates cultripes]
TPSRPYGKEKDGSPERREHTESPLPKKPDPTDKRASPEISSEQIPVGKVDIENILSELKAYFSADIARIREDMGVMTSQLRVLEEENAKTKGQQEDLKVEVEKLKQANLVLESKLAELEVRGVPEVIVDDKVPNFRRLLSCDFRASSSYRPRLRMHLPTSLKAQTFPSSMTYPGPPCFGDTHCNLGPGQKLKALHADKRFTLTHISEAERLFT